MFRMPLKVEGGDWGAGGLKMLRFEETKNVG